MELQRIKESKINGERVDSENGLQYLRARYYNMDLGRFTTRDDYQGEDSTPANLNRYLYGKGNPIKWVDPSGRNTLMELEVTERIITINSMIASVKLHGFLAVAVQTVWGIPWDKTAFQVPVASMDGVSLSGGGLGLRFHLVLKDLSLQNIIVVKIGIIGMGELVLVWDYLF